jgi:hypothetical protein
MHTRSLAQQSAIAAARITRTRRARRAWGASATEYLIVILLFAVTGIAGYRTLGVRYRCQMQVAAQKLFGSMLGRDLERVVALATKRRMSAAGRWRSTAAPPSGAPAKASVSISASPTSCPTRAITRSSSSRTTTAS